MDQQSFHFDQLQIAEPRYHEQGKTHESKLGSQPRSAKVKPPFHGLNALLLSPLITKPVFTFDTGKFLVSGLEFLSNVAHMRVDGVVRHQTLHGRVHQGFVTHRMPRRANQFGQHAKLGARQVNTLTFPAHQQGILIQGQIADGFSDAFSVVDNALRASLMRKSAEIRSARYSSEMGFGR